ncbi:MAG: hypothetical protein M1272_02895 [Firmicutes bacterium]|nr:hypothetical protein [Bacillota bacterium]
MAVNDRQSLWNPERQVAVHVSQEPWRLSDDVVPRVERHWETVNRTGGRFFRGPLLTVSGVERRSDRTIINACWTDYAHFLYSSRHLLPDHPDYVRVLFAAGCLITQDGYFLAGVMGSETSRPGWIQAVGGSAEPNEVSNALFDPILSVVREVREETGFNLLDPRIARSMQVAGFTEDSYDGSIAVAVKVELQWTHQEALRQFAQFRATASILELSDLRAVPLGDLGRQWLDGQSEPVVRYLRALIQAPELAPVGGPGD